MSPTTATRGTALEPGNTSLQPPRRDLIEGFRRVRAFTRALCEPLETEDYVVQSMPDVSPTKWHLAHTTWFFEAFILAAEQNDYHPFHEQYSYLFNSYYFAMGKRWFRPQRGLLTRPTVKEIFAYRDHVDQAFPEFLERLDDADYERIAPLVVLGLNHEQQHQELMLTDLKHVLAQNPLHPVYREPRGEMPGNVAGLDWGRYSGGTHEIGHGGEGFCYDNEQPRHTVHLDDFLLASRPITCGEYTQFMKDGGYENVFLWLSDAWATVQEEKWNAPLYWERKDDRWWHMTLSGFRPVDLDEPVTHVSYYEADAFARWSGARLPTEAEWEIATESVPIEGNFVENEAFHPCASAPPTGNGPAQLLGDVWEWTGSAYLPYPGYRPAEGAVGEYNGKFMCNQFVLRGGSCATSRTHIRKTYRNFVYPHQRWQFTGIRLAKEARS